MDSESVMAAGEVGCGGPDGGAVRWIAVDWGTSRLRAWAMGAGDRPLAEAVGDRGMGRLDPAEFEAALIEAAGGWAAAGRVTPVLICGMAGSREGWRQAPYADLATPLAELPRRAVAAPSTDPRFAVRILPGLRQDAPPDVMRGEETQLLGLLRRRPGFAGVACLPGTHSKWAHLADGRVTRFHTYMTGELRELLAARSVLRHVVGGAAADGSFEPAVAEAAADPAAWSRRLFGVRAAALIAGLSPEAASGRLSGLLIGAELADALADVGPEAEIAVIGSETLGDLYLRALGVLGRRASIEPGEACALAGLTAARQALAETAHDA